jgi:hypothetical protein
MLGDERPPLSDERSLFEDERHPFGEERKPFSDERHPSGDERHPSGDERSRLGDERNLRNVGRPRAGTDSPRRAPIPRWEVARTHRVRHASTLAAALTLGAVVSCRSQGASPIAEAYADQTPAVARAPGAVAVVELFTSEGCSSCPPADATLAELASGRDVYALAFHVDYWDDLGWPDRFASAANTARQRAYASTFGARGVYTPQMIVGGREPFVGSDRDHADAAIARALSSAPVVLLTLQARRTGDTLTVDYTSPGAPAGAALDVAVVERATSTEVRAGENSGRTLKHTNVVRAFTVVPLASPGGSTTLRIPPGLRAQDGEVIAFAQAPATPGTGMPILGAARAPLP